MNQYYLGIDNGGTVTKAALYDEKGREVGLCAQKAKIIMPQPGFVERDLNELAESVKVCVRGVIEKSGVNPKQIEAVSTSCHGKGLYLIDKDGNPSHNGIISSDSRALEITKTLKKDGAGEKIYPISYQQLWAGHPAMLLRWFAENNPDVLNQTESILMGHDYMRYCLTGEIGAEITNISGSALVDVSKKDYSDAILSFLGLEEISGKLPPIIGSTEQCGRITVKAAEETGLAAGTPVYGGFFDVVAAAVSSGLINSDEINSTMGTWAISTCLSPKIVSSEYPHIWGNYCLDDMYFAHEGSPTSASNLDWFIRNFIPKDKTENALSRCDVMAESASNDEKLLFFPFLYASNIEDSMKATFWGLQSHHKDQDVLRAVYEGIVFSHAMHLERLYEVIKDVKQITMVGGPTNSRFWMQMFADITEKRITIPDCKEAGCKGAAMAAMVGHGLYRNFDEAVENTVSFRESFSPDSRQKDFFQNKLNYYKETARALSAIPS